MVQVSDHGQSHNRVLKQLARAKMYNVNKIKCEEITIKFLILHKRKL